MTVYFNGMSKEETASLTEAMLYSGKVLNLNSIPGIKIDKHSTGGVGDKTSLIIAPIVSATGVKVPMISGRGWDIPVERSISLKRFPVLEPILLYPNIKMF